MLPEPKSVPSLKTPLATTSLPSLLLDEKGISGRVGYCLTAAGTRTEMGWETTCRWGPDEEGRTGISPGCELSAPSSTPFSPAAAAEDCFLSLGTSLRGTECCVCLFSWGVICWICYKNFLAWDPHWGMGLGWELRGHLSCWRCAHSLFKLSMQAYLPCTSPFVEISRVSVGLHFPRWILGTLGKTMAQDWPCSTLG